MRRKVTPIGALARGLIAGATGALAQSLFFRLTSRVAPKPPEGVFEPAEPEQASEMATATVARRLVEGMAARQLDPMKKDMGAQAVHIGFGSAWGGLYGLVRESLPGIAAPNGWGLLGLLGYSTTVWMVGDNVVLPLFRLSAWPHKYPAKVHAYAFGAHLVYGLAACLTYEALRPSNVAVVAGALSTLMLRRRLVSRLPDVARPAAKKAVHVAATLRDAALLSRGRAAIDALRAQ